MFQVDTDILSALRRRDRHLEVVRWLDARRVADLHLHVVTTGEVERGITQQCRQNMTFEADLTS